MKVKSRILSILFVVIFIFVGCVSKVEETGGEIAGQLKIHYIDVGQADSILIQQNSSTMLIDAGNNEDSNLVVNYIKKQGIKKLDYVIGTHPHEDHIGGLDKVIDSFEIGKILMPNKISTTRTFKDVVLAIKNKKMNITNPVPGTTYSLGEAKWTILAPTKGKNYESINDYSIVCKLSFGNTAFMFTGDAETLSESEILSRGYNLKSNVLKVGHHGSSSSTSDAFLAKVNPSYAVISCGKNNKYGHPHKSTIQKLQLKNIPVYRTDECGTIICTSDGKKISFNCEIGNPKYKDKSESSENKSNVKKTSNSSVIIENIDKKEEVVLIQNNSNKNINLKGWRLKSVRGNQEYVFPNYVLKSNSSVSIVSGEKSGDLKWGKKNVWSNSKSDPGELYNNNGKLIFRYND